MLLILTPACTPRRAAALSSVNDCDYVARIRTDTTCRKQVQIARHLFQRPVDLAGRRSFADAEYDPVSQRGIGHFGQTFDRYDTTIVRDRRGALLRLHGCEGDQRGGNSEKSDADHRAFLAGLTIVVVESQSYGQLNLRTEERRVGKSV